MSKQVNIYLSRKITLARKGMQSLALAAGRNTVDADVADHAFVKAHCINAADAADVAKADAKAEARAKAAEAALALSESEVADLKAANEELQKQLDAKTAELEAMVAAFDDKTKAAGKK